MRVLKICAKQAQLALCLCALVMAGPTSAGKADAASPRMPASKSNLFAAHDWQPPPPKVVPVVEAPRAPPLPFTYEGKLVQGNEVTAFINQAGTSRALKVGDTVASYRVTQITTSGITFLYVPLNQTQTLSFGSAN